MNAPLPRPPRARIDEAVLVQHLAAWGSARPGRDSLGKWDGLLDFLFAWGEKCYAEGYQAAAGRVSPVVGMTPEQQTKYEEGLQIIDRHRAHRESRERAEAERRELADRRARPRKP